MANDTHGATGQGWYGFDLDGTLAKYEKWEGIDHIGEPIKPMVDLIKKMHEDGEVVKILTARVAPRENVDVADNPFGGNSTPLYASGYLCGLHDHKGFYERPLWTARDFIADWCLKNLGFLPEITHEKDHLMLNLYDDRVKQVIQNTGELVEDILIRQSRFVEAYRCNATDYKEENLRLNRKLDCKFNGFFAGMMLGSLIALAINLSLSYFLRSKTPQTEALNHLRSAIIEVQESLDTPSK